MGYVTDFLRYSVSIVYDSNSERGIPDCLIMD